MGASQAASVIGNLMRFDRSPVTAENSEGEAGASAFVPESDDFLRLSTGRCVILALASGHKIRVALRPKEPVHLMATNSNPMLLS